MATGKLIGADDATAGARASSELVWFSKSTAVATGTMTEFKIKVPAGYSGHVKVAIYADSGGEPAGRISYDNTSYAVVAGWNTISFPSTNILNGTVYWLAVAAEAYVVGYSGSGVERLKTITYSTYTFPDPAGTGYTSDTLGDLFAGWGVVPQTLLPSSIVQAIAYGTPTVATAALIIYPTSVVQPISIGTPALLYPQILLPSSIIQAIVYGTPSVGIVGQAGFIYPQSIVQQISIGSPIILKYVWHVILDGQYATETPGVNRAYIIGRDQYGNPVWGEAQDSTEIALVGERLDFQPDPAIPTTAQAGDVASAVLSKMRLRGKGGVILIPPNCGQELFDVVQISDAGANQSAVTFRVVGIRFEYNPKLARYQYRLILGAP